MWLGIKPPIYFGPPYNFTGLSNIIKYHATSIQLQNIEKKVFEINDYFLKMKNIVYKLIATREPMDEQRLILHILSRLRVEYNPFVT